MALAGIALAAPPERVTAEPVDADLLAHAGAGWTAVPNLASWRRGPAASIGIDAFFNRLFGLSAEATAARLLVTGGAPDDASPSTLFTLSAGPVVRADIGSVVPFVAVHGALTLDEGVLGDPEKPADAHFGLRASLGLEFAPRDHLRVAVIGEWGAVTWALLDYPAWTTLRVRLGWTNDGRDW